MMRVNAVLRVAEGSPTVSDHDLADTKAASRRQHGHEAVQLAVQPHLAEHLALITFHAAVVVV